MPLECCLSRRRGSLLRQAQDGELAEPQPRWDWRRLRTCATRPGRAGLGPNRIGAGMPLLQVLQQSLLAKEINLYDERTQ